MDMQAKALTLGDAAKGIQCCCDQQVTEAVDLGLTQNENGWRIMLYKWWFISGIDTEVFT